jgi:Putative beta-lactamase-inhibitor-like, PepSY-like
MRRYNLGTVLAAVIGMSGLWALAEEKEIPLDKVPAKVLDAVKAKWPKAKIEEAEVDDEDGKTVYEFELEEEDGKNEREWSATFSADGKFIESEEEVKLSDVPKATLDALLKKYPLAKKPKVEKVTQGEGATPKVFYELRFTIEAKIDAAGQILGEEEVVKGKDSD